MSLSLIMLLPVWYPSWQYFMVNDTDTNSSSMNIVLSDFLADSEQVVVLKYLHAFPATYIYKQIIYLHSQQQVF